MISLRRITNEYHNLTNYVGVSVHVANVYG